MGIEFHETLDWYQPKSSPARARQPRDGLEEGVGEEMREKDGGVHRGKIIFAQGI